MTAVWMYYVNVLSWYQIVLQEEYLPGFVWNGPPNQAMWHVPTTRICPW